MLTATAEVPASQKLLALYPNLRFDRAVAERLLEEKCFPRTLHATSQLPATATLQDVFDCFQSDLLAEEFLWHYIEAVTGETNVCNRTY